ncbi:NAD(P)/FAD-dependent oxidoreductase [Hymenobacter rubripertinctus]|uniref:NADH:ubiquinone reductase (non-electrogenic) n=1 Tax=Hymenobacter rubripertinctus TaxID=2029981 RepID=A0A418R1X5_9BACT|nr:NAD(P)/FAD-dependent oxidoreductase [Hymenobacter rubripertinctus]RIY11378.1 NAD(P)/FAD-dependent oxidoreductase [Hymenobacter rubripertinctus]
MDTNLPRTSQPRIVIIGCGFAGLRLAKDLADAPVQVVVIDRNNYHNFQPLLYQVATGALEADSIAYPIRKIFAGQPNFFYRMADVQRVDAGRNTLVTNIGEIGYDHLVLATGSLTNFFGLDSIEQNAMQIKSIPNALNLRSYLFQNFEKALLTDDPAQRQALLNVVVVGGGPTGVEICGSLAEMRKDVLPQDYPELDLKQMEIYLIESGAEVLGPMSKDSQVQAKKYLEDMGIHLRLNTHAQRFEAGKLYYSETEFIRTENLIWAAGVNGAAVEGLPETVVARNKRINVDTQNRVLGLANVYAIGDVANLATDEMPRGYPMLAPVAIQQAEQLADNFRHLLRGEPLKPFKYVNKGSMAIVGRNRAVVDLPGNTQFGGFFGWLTWLFVHLMTLVGFRNKVVTLISWGISYFSSDKALRLIIRPYKRYDFKEDKGLATAMHNAATPEYHPPVPAPNAAVVGG